MSANHCPVCGGGNPPGSKFCNNCGSPLPPETHIVCPNCQHYNPLHLLYCDYCGTRLVHEESAAEPALPERDLPAAPKAFHLPTRATDDTGELKLPPLHQPAIHDWLKDEAPADTPQAEPPARPSPATPEPLEPDAGAADPAFADFARWLEDIQAVEDDAPPDEAAPPPTPPPAASELVGWLDTDDEVVSPRADLPDWLRAAAPRGTGILSSPPDTVAGGAPPLPELSPASDVPDWLAEIAPPGTGMLTGRRGLDQEDLFDALAAEFELPDWLHPADITVEDKVEPPPGQTPPAPPPPKDDKEPSPSPKPEKTPDWLGQLTVVESEPPQAAEALPDWLAELESETEAAPPATELPDWLATFAAAEIPSAETPETAPAVTAEQPIELEAASWVGAAAADESLAGPAEPAASAEMADAEMALWPGEQAETAPDFVEDSLLDAERTAAGDFPDWLQEIQDTTEADEAPPEIPDWLATADSGEVEGEEPAAGLTFTPASLAEDLPDWFDSLFGDDALAETALEAGAGEELLPDWLAEFGGEDEALAGMDIAQLPESAPEQAELAEWISYLPAAQTPAEFDADLGQSDLAGDEWLAETLPTAESPAPLTEQVMEEEELASAELPDWLQDSLRRSSGDAAAPSLADLFAASDSKAPAAGTDLAELPDWLQPPDADSFDAALQAALSSRDEAGSALGAGDEWSDVLEAMPADVPDIALPSASEFAGMGAAAAELAAAEIPEWLQPFKPRELRGPGETYAPTEPVQETGPLAGMRGVIDIEPVIAQPRQADSDLPQFTVTPAQRQQASLLRQLAQASAAPVTAADAGQPAVMPAWLRLLLALLLLAALLAAALLPNLVSDLVGAAEASLPAGAAAAHQAIEAAAGQPVLVAFDYTPAMNGELGPAAQLLLGQLAANGSPVLTISQSAAGVALARQATSQTANLNGTSLGYLPGEAVGLRLLGECLPALNSCQTIAGAPLSRNASAAPVGLVILLTADQENLINWVEQVGSASQTPLVAAVTQSFSPAAGPYFASRQLAGLIEGLPAAVAYERQVTGTAGPVAALSHTQGLAYWLVILLLLGGNLFYLAAGLVSRRRSR